MLNVISQCLVMIGMAVFISLGQPSSSILCIGKETPDAESQSHAQAAHRFSHGPFVARMACCRRCRAASTALTAAAAHAELCRTAAHSLHKDVSRPSHRY